jgi:hypothetical protein
VANFGIGTLARLRWRRNFAILQPLNEMPRLRRSVPPQNIDAMAVYLAAQKDHAGGARSAVVQIEARNDADRRNTKVIQ